MNITLRATPFERPLWMGPNHKPLADFCLRHDDLLTAREIELCKRLTTTVNPGIDSLVAISLLSREVLTRAGS